MVSAVGFQPKDSSSILGWNTKLEYSIMVMPVAVNDKNFGSSPNIPAILQIK